MAPSAPFQVVASNSQNADYDRSAADCAHRHQCQPILSAAKDVIVENGVVELRTRVADETLETQEADGESRDGRYDEQANLANWEYFRACHGHSSSLPLLRSARSLTCFSRGAS